MGHRAKVYPQCHRTFGVRAGFQVIDDERRLWLVVDVEPRLCAAHLDLDLGPFVGDRIAVRLVLLRALVAKAGIRC